MDTTELVQKCKLNDHKAFGLLYDEFADRIFKYIKIKVRDPQQAEDILQDVFVKAWAGIPTLKLEGLNFSAWLYKVTGNTINDHFRKIYRRPLTVSLEENIDSDKIADPMDNTKDIDHPSPLLIAALGSLPEKYRQVLELRFVQDFTLGETAKILHKTNLAVRLLQHRALKKLREILKDNHDL